MSDLRDRAIRLYDDFTHRHLDRRRLMRELTALAGSLAAAEALVAGIAASPAHAEQVAGDDPRLVTNEGHWIVGPDNLDYRVYSAILRERPHPLPAVMVVHENRGLNAHIKDVVRRLALEGFDACAPDFLSPAGGTPEDEDKAREMIGALDLGAAAVGGIAVAKMAATQRTANRHVGIVGFCWGGGMVNRIAAAGDPGIAAAVAYYGPAPDPAEAAKVTAAMMLHYAGKDARVAATGGPWTDALIRGGGEVAAFTYPGVDHAFNNDTSAARYDKAAADLAWARTVEFLHRHLDGARI